MRTVREKIVYKKLELPKHYIFLLKNAIKMLTRAQKDMSAHMSEQVYSEGAKWLIENQKILLKRAEETKSQLKGVKKLPVCAQNKQKVRVLLCAENILKGQTVVKKEDIVYYIEHNEIALGYDEIQAFYLSMSVVLLKKVLCAALLLKEEARNYTCAQKALKKAPKGALKALKNNKKAYQMLQNILLLKGDEKTLQLVQMKGNKMVFKEDKQSEPPPLFLLRHAVLCLRALKKMPFEQVKEQISPVYTAFKKDETYCKMDRQSRHLYLFKVHQMTKKFKVPEKEIVQSILALTKGQTGAQKEVGTYLFENQKKVLEHLGKKNIFFSLKTRETLFVCAHCILFIALFLGVFWINKEVLLALLLSLLLYDFISLLACKTVLKYHKNGLLPKLLIRQLDEQLRTLVVVPTLITNRQHALFMVRHLRELRALTPEQNVEFMLLCDLKDAHTRVDQEDQGIVDMLKESVFLLNQNDENVFHLMVRERQMSKTQNKYIGRERKRGSLQSLLNIIADETVEDFYVHQSVPHNFLKNRYRYVVTLDQDTLLLKGDLRRMVGAMEHPLQKDKVGVMQPKMLSHPMSVQTNVQRKLFTECSVPSYLGAIKDVYQDVFSKGSFVGKGIINPVVFCQRIKGKIKNEKVLSHDLIEGEIVCSKVLEDVFMLDQNPKKVSGFYKRYNRWVRGDVQLLPFLGKRYLSLLSKFKILDNMKNALVPLAKTGVILYGAYNNMPWLFVFALSFPLKKAFIHLIFLPYKAYAALDGIVRALFRMLFSKKNLLSWVTADQTDVQINNMVAPYFFTVFVGGVTLYLSLVHALPIYFAIGFLHVLFPLFVPYFDQNEKEKDALKEPQRQTLLLLAQKTFAFFDEHVTEKTNDLPPDNLQVSPDKGRQMRTSPTNMGFYLLSLYCAKELGFISQDTLFERVKKSVHTLKKLPKYKGHFYNWYDIEHLEVLAPPFVSSVDEGNLMACLLTLLQALRGEKTLVPSYQEVLYDIQKLVMDMDLSMLQNKKEGLFAIGLHTESGMLTEGCYDLFASEALILTYVAVMLNIVPVSNFKHLQREITKTKGGNTLLSWSGTAFEYLLPMIFFPTKKGTLLYDSNKSFIKAQIKKNVLMPFGISESGYYAFDCDLNYQYKAFGLYEAALSKETEGNVIAPYASILFLKYVRKKVLKNIEILKNWGAEGAFGLYEALDFEKARSTSPPAVVKSYMAHHQGMILCAITNALCNNKIERTFSQLPMASAHHYLLMEKGIRHEKASKITQYDVQKGVHQADEGYHVLTQNAAQVLHAKHTSCLMDSKGTGYIRYKDLYLTRYVSPHTSGVLYYVKNHNNNKTMPLFQEPHATIYQHAVVYTSHFEGLYIRETRFLSAMEGAFVSSFEVQNKSEQDVAFSLTSYLEPAMSTLKEDEAHPNFRDLFIVTEKVGKRALIARRKKRSEQEQEGMLVHFFVGSVKMLDFCVNKAQFIGRNRDVYAPKLLFQNAEEKEKEVPSVFPCLSIQAHLEVQKKSAVTFSFVTSYVHTKEQADAMLRTFSQKEDVKNALELSKTHGMLLLKMFDYPIMRSVFLYHFLYRILFDQTKRAYKYKKEDVWQFAISLDHPILLLCLKENSPREEIKNILKDIAFLSYKGITIDLVFLKKKGAEYSDMLHTFLRAEISVSKIKHNHVFIIEDTKENENILSCFCTLKIVLHQKMTLQDVTMQAQTVIPPTLMPSMCHEIAVDKKLNKYGSLKGERAFVVHNIPPLPWCYFLATEHFSTLVCESGILFSCLRNSRMEKLTRRHKDVLNPQNAEEIYVLNEQKEMLPLCSGTVVYELGTATYFVETSCFTAQTTCFTDADMRMGVRDVVIKNKGQEGLHIELCYQVHFSMGESGKWTHCEAQKHAVHAFHPDFNGFTCAYMENAVVHNDVLYMPLHIPKNEKKRCTMCLLYAENEQEKTDMLEVLYQQGVLKRMRKVKEYWENSLSRLSVSLNDAHMERCINTFFPYQTLSSRIFMRSSLYQEGGAYGFRDQLQDMLALLYTDQDRVKAHILRSASHQFIEGDVQHWWHEERKGVRTKISDDKLFLPFLTACYIEATGDQSILKEQVPYVKSAPLGEHEEERYETPQVTEYMESLQMHCNRAIESVKLGEKSLPLMGSGDWNDGMNKIAGKRGESVWLCFFYIFVLDQYKKYSGKEQVYDKMQKQMKKDANVTWDESWFIRCYDQNAFSVGGKNSAVPRIDLISQAFSVFAQMKEDRTTQAIKSALEKLFDRENGVVKLLDPPFSEQEKAGYISSYVPYVRENGGQYTHAVAFMILALCQKGMIEEAWDMLIKILPLNHADSDEKIDVYKVEPYALSADVYAGALMGQGGWTWYTGSASWMQYAFYQGLMGLKIEGDTLKFSPKLKKDMHTCTVYYTYQDTRYILTGDKNVFVPKLDGKIITNGVITLQNDGKTHVYHVPVVYQNIEI